MGRRVTLVDASAIVAILVREPDAERLSQAIDAAPPPLLVSPLTIFEASLSLARAKLGPRPARKPTSHEIRAALAVVVAFVEANDLTEIEISGAIGRQAVEAAAVYGKAVGHEADLNFGDCFAYAAAKANGARLVYKGEDFSRTDLA